MKPAVNSRRAATPRGKPAVKSPDDPAAPAADVEERVRERTRELTILNEELHAEIHDRIRTEQSLLEEKAFREAMENCLHAGVSVVDRKGRHTHVNDALCVMTGLSRSELLDSGIPYPYWPSENTAAYGKSMRGILNGAPIPADGVEMRYRSRGGRPVDVALYASPLMSGGTIRGHVVTVHNITGRKQAEAALRDSEESFRSLVQSLPVGVCILQDGEVAFANPEQRRILGPDAEHGASIPSLNVHPDDVPAFRALLNDVRSAPPASRETDIRIIPHGSPDPAGEVRWTRTRAARIRYRRDVAVLLIMLDITRDKEIEHILAVQEKLASLGQLSAGIAHEVRNPLSGIILSLPTLDQIFERWDGTDPEARATLRAMIEYMKSSSSKIASVIQRIMDFAKPAPYPVGPVDMNCILEAALKDAAAILRKTGVTVSRRLAGDLPQCCADPHLMGQVMSNLIANAVQAMDSCQGPRLLEVASTVENGRVIVRISDSGPGVPHRLRSRIFEPFFTTRKDGHGIGLSISHRIITEHAGAISVGKSRWGGAEFRIVLPGVIPPPAIPPAGSVNP